MFDDHQDSILRSIESSFLQRSVSAPPIAENVGSAHIPQWTLGDYSSSGQESRGFNEGLYYQYAPSSLNPRLPKQFPKHEPAHDHDLLRGLTHEPVTELAGGFADEQSIQREYGLGIHAQSGGKTPLDQIQEDFPTTPSRIFSDSAPSMPSQPVVQNGGHLNGVLDNGAGMQPLGNGTSRLRMVDSLDVDGAAAAMRHLNLGVSMPEASYARRGQYVAQPHPVAAASAAAPHHPRGLSTQPHAHPQHPQHPQMIDRRAPDPYYAQPAMAAPRAARAQIPPQYAVDSRGYPAQQFVYAAMDMPAYPQEVIYQAHEPRAPTELQYLQYHPQQPPHAQAAYWQDGTRTVMIPQMATRDGQPLHVPVHMLHMYQQPAAVLAHQQAPPRMGHPPKIIPPQVSPQLSPTVMSPTTEDKGKGTPRRDGDRRDRGRNDARGAQPPRDPMVEEFRNTFGKSRQWELQDLRGHVVAFCQDQHGSRFIQQKLEEAVEVDKQLVFDEILPHAHALMKDVFGNYVVQKLFEYGTDEQRACLASLLVGQAVPLALQMYGCRVIQKALEYVDQSRLLGLVAEFEGQVLRCVHDQNGNHVIQKCIEVVSRVAREAPPEQSTFLSGKIQFIIDAFRDHVKELAMHPYGCRVIQRILEHCTNSQKAFVLEEIRHCCHELIRDQYGNYVIQHVMQHGWANDKAILLAEVKNHILEFSQHKFASNVVEKCMQYCSKIDRDEMIEAIMAVDARGTCVLEAMLRDPYANYVVQRIIEVADERHRERIVKYVQENIAQLRRYTYGKHIIAKLEKITGQRL